MQTTPEDPVAQDLLEAVHSLVAHELDRRILLELLLGGDETRYEGLRLAVGETSKQRFQDALARLQLHSLVDRRLEPAGKRYWSWFSCTSRGKRLSTAILGLARKGALPRDTDASTRAAFRTELSGGHRLNPIPRA